MTKLLGTKTSILLLKRIKCNRQFLLKSPGTTLNHHDATDLNFPSPIHDPAGRVKWFPQTLKTNKDQFLKNKIRSLDSTTVCHQPYLICYGINKCLNHFSYQNIIIKMILYSLSNVFSSHRSIAGFQVIHKYIFQVILP